MVHYWQPVRCLIKPKYGRNSIKLIVQSGAICGFFVPYNRYEAIDYWLLVHRFVKPTESIYKQIDFL